MRGLFLSFSHKSPILLVGLLALSTHLLWAQRTSPLEKIPIQLLDTPASFARVSEARTRLHLDYRRPQLTFEQNQDRSESRMRFFLHCPGYCRVPINANAALFPPTGTTELWGRENHLIGSDPSKWLAFVPTYGTAPHEPIYRVENLEHYGQRIPWVGSIILRIGQQAKAHPHVTRVLTSLTPRL
jgi:hypothetical protein